MFDEPMAKADICLQNLCLHNLYLQTIDATELCADLMPHRPCLLTGCHHRPLSADPMPPADLCVQIR